MEKIKVIVADDMEGIRNWFRSLFINDPYIEFTGVAPCGAAAYDLVMEKAPDIVLMDIEMETKYSGIDYTRKITENYPNVKVIILTMHDDDDILINSYMAGAKAFLLKNSSADQISDTIKSVYNGRYILDENGAKKVVKRLSQYDVERKRILYMMNIFNTLTRTELEILKSLYDGSSYKDIAKMRFIEKKTLENHVTSILKKFNAKTSKQLVSNLKELHVFDNLLM